jgi:hypothetical protein
VRAKSIRRATAGSPSRRFEVVWVSVCDIKSPSGR